MTNTLWQPTLVWSWARTLRVSMLIALGFTIFGFVLHGSGEGAWRNWRGWLEWYGLNLVISLCVSVTIRQLFALSVAWLGQARVLAFKPLARGLYFAGVPLLGVAIGSTLGLWLTGDAGRVWFDTRDANSIAASVLLSVLISSIFFLIFNAKARQAEAERRAAEAQLRLLQGQIEPHFLFNTLAGVISLIDHEPAKAKQMLQDFTEYLRSSLGALRSDDGTLAQELDLAEHYLRLLGARMEDRLHWHIEADEAARRISVPPLLLQPLVENAIHHGLEPQLEGGTVQVSAHVQGGQLVLQVSDDGRGLGAPNRAGARKGAGMALQNIRERLQSRYGHLASLELQATQPGTRVVMRLPLEGKAV
jgi:LytS/YehU family sensor histidine kinase